MKKLTSILKNQTIRIDNHDSGTGRAFKWGTGVHIHKILNEKNTKVQSLLSHLIESEK